jgi:hypothetical protein
MASPIVIIVGTSLVAFLVAGLARVIFAASGWFWWSASLTEALINSLIGLATLFALNEFSKLAPLLYSMKP